MVFVYFKIFANHAGHTIKNNTPGNQNSINNIISA